MSINQWNGRVWEGVFCSFDEAKGENDVFHDSLWIDKQREQIKNKLSQLDDDKDAGISSIAQSNDYYLSVILASQYEEHKKKLSVLDFGGGLGNTYLEVAKILANEVDLTYVIVENENLCQQGIELYKEDHQLEFSVELPVNTVFDTVHAGSSIQYVEDWLGVLKKFSDYQPKYIVFADLPAGDIDTFVSIQNYYGKKIPAWFWNLSEFINSVEVMGYKLVAKYRYFNKHVETMSEFDEKHRLSHFSQLIFKSCGN